MIQLNSTDEFENWLNSLRDIRAKQRIMSRLTSVAKNGNFGDTKPVGGGVYEMRIHHDAGYRVYYTRRGETVYLLLLGGDKSTQQRDIKKAASMAEQLKKEKT